MKKHKSTLKLAYIGVLTAILAVSSQLSIPMPAGVPMTLQTLVIPLAAIIFGPYISTAAVCAYIAIGVFGLPVFAGAQSGISALVGPTGGFLMSFPLMSLLAGWGAKSGKPAPLWLGLTAGAVLNFAVGIAVFCVYQKVGFKAAFMATTLPFIPTAVLKIVIAAPLGKKLKGMLFKQTAALQTQTD